MVHFAAQNTQPATEQTVLGLPTGPWRCFHCGDVFTAWHCARDHFGHEDGALPACQIKGGEIGLVAALRAAERDASDAWFALQNESTTTAKAFRAMQGRHQQQLTAMEQLGYERGLADAKAHPEELGLMKATPPLASNSLGIGPLADEPEQKPHHTEGDGA
jgi:hypothetical protein